MYGRNKVKKVPNDRHPVIDLDALQMGEPPFPYKENEHSQIDDNLDEPSFVYEGNVGDVQPTIDDDAEEPRSPLIMKCPAP